MPDADSLLLTSYLKRILNAKVYDLIDETPLDEAPALSARTGNRVLLKREDLQPVFSFKVRGAYNKMALLKAEELARGVIAASAGNHAQGVAMAAQELGCNAVIVMPTTTPELKVDAVRTLGAEVVLVGESFSDSFLHAQQLQAQRGLTFVHPFDDPDVIAGQGTIGMEIARQCSAVDAVFVAIGGGGLVSGVGAYLKAVRPEIRVIGVQANDSNAMMQSVAVGERIELPTVGLFSDGTAVKLVGEHTFALAQQVVDEIITVDTDQICAAIKDTFTDTRAIVEPAGALAVAGLKSYVESHGISNQTLIAVACGANMNFDRLRFVAERAEIGEQREAVFAVTIPERPGSFRKFLDAIGDDRAITEFNYRMADADAAHVFVGVQVQSRDEAGAIADGFAAAELDALDLTDDELAKLHLRHLVGGRLVGATGASKDERLFRFEFPERPGALKTFLHSMAPAWNISLFHYRNHGSDVGRVLAGMQVPAADGVKFEEFLQGLGYEHWEETANPAYQLFLR